MLYSVLDVKSGSFGPLLEQKKDEEAVRSFLITIQNAPKNDLLGLFPEDFALYRVGDFNHFNGEISFEPTPYKLITGLECVQMLRGSSSTSSECSCSNQLVDKEEVLLNGSEEEVNV